MHVYADIQSCESLPCEAMNVSVEEHLIDRCKKRDLGAGN